LLYKGFGCLELLKFSAVFEFWGMYCHNLYDPTELSIVDEQTSADRLWKPANMYGT
jgi:hypothetical protein